MLGNQFRITRSETRTPKKMNSESLSAFFDICGKLKVLKFVIYNIEYKENGMGVS